jgi:hypothetical protein
MFTSLFFFNSFFCEDILLILYLIPYKMKTPFTFLLALLCITAHSQDLTALVKQKSSSLTANNAIAVNNTDSWYDKARQYIRDQEYHVNWNSTLGQYTAVNRNNHLAFFFTGDGYRILSFANAASTDDNWEYNFHLKNIYRGNHQLLKDLPAIVKQGKSELSYEYPQYAIKYFNDVKGMRQNFIINEKLPGQEKLQLAINLEGTLQASVVNETRLILSSVNKETKKTKLNYDELKVWDRNHQLLDAHMKLMKDGKTLLIVVNDETAVYPVTIDPLNHVPDWTDSGLGVLPALDVLYGSSLSNAGDVNNDGYDDIIIGAPANINVLSSTIVASTGQAFIYLGSSTGPSVSPDIVLQSSTTINGLFGFSVSNAGDINNDGFDDVIVGAPGDQVTLNFGIPFGSLSNDIGKVYVYYGNSNPAAIPGSVLTINLKTTDFSGATFGLTINPLFGFSVSGAGDVNNDGYADVIVGSPAYTDVGTLTLGGRATVYLGSGSGLNIASPIHRNGSLLSNSLFGFSVSCAGDMNNDGADEVLIGAPGALSLLPGLTGVAYVYPGISAPTPGGIASSPVSYTDGFLLKTLFGFSVSNAGDVNNDGYDDIVVGQPATLSLSGLVTVGKASIFFGSSSLTIKSTSDISLRSPRDPDVLGLATGNLLFGYSVSGGKDLDCDGINDVIVGEPGGTALTGLSGINATGGQAYIYFGKNGSGPATLPEWELKETGSLVVANLLGSCVSMAGDVNGDGKQDVLIGASNGTLNLANVLTGVLNFTFVQSVGSAYVHFGCITPTLFTFPVTLSYFKGHLENNTVILEWETASEQNFSHYDIERSVNGSVFKKIGQISSKGESNTLFYYNFVDNGPATGTNIYRLKMVDKDGKFTYSSLINIVVKSRTSIHVTSNVVSTTFTIEFNNMPAGLYKVDLLNMNGQTVQSMDANVSANYTTEPVTIKGGTAKGMYIVRVQKAGSPICYQEKILIK